MRPVRVTVQVEPGFPLVNGNPLVLEPSTGALGCGDALALGCGDALALGLGVVLAWGALPRMSTEPTGRCLAVVSTSTLDLLGRSDVTIAARCRGRWSYVLFATRRQRCQKRFISCCYVAACSSRLESVEIGLRPESS